MSLSTAAAAHDLPEVEERGFTFLAGVGLCERPPGHIDKCKRKDLLDGSGPRQIVGKVG